MQRSFASTPSDRRSVFAFTLIELFAVVAIIAILASLLLTALSTAKARARTTLCKNNLRQLALATTLYVADYGMYPLFGMFVLSGADIRADSILNLISPYLGQQVPPLEINGTTLKETDPLGGMPYHCPEQLPWRARYLDYGYNVAGVDLTHNRARMPGKRDFKASTTVASVSPSMAT